MREWGLSEELKIQTKQMIEIAEKELSIMRSAIDKEDECILCKMEDIHHMLANVQTLAATYYIQAYLSPYTESSSFITTAIQHLSARKHGALIVVERNETLEAFIQTGTTLNAHLTAPLLNQYFIQVTLFMMEPFSLKIIILSQLPIFFRSRKAQKLILN